MTNLRQACRLRSRSAQERTGAKTRSLALALLLGAFAGTGACSARLGSGDDEPNDLADLSDTPGGVELDCQEGASLTVAPLLKLSTKQYENTVHDLLEKHGLQSLIDEVEGPLGSIPDDSLEPGFRRLDDRVTLQHVQGYFNAGVVVGDGLLDDPALLEEAFGSCATDASLSAECWQNFVDGFLRDVYRRPLTNQEREQYSTLEASGPKKIRQAIVVAMSAPRFVYHVETDGEEGRDPRLLKLDAYEIASRLSYTFWGTMPDDELFRAAETGKLLDTEGYGAQLQRVFEDPRARETLRTFWHEWLKLEKFTGFETTRPGFESFAEGLFVGQPGHDYYGDMVDEVTELTALYTFEQPGTVADLLTSPLSVTQSDDLASLYGVEPWDGVGPYPTLPAQERAGLFQRGALLASNLETTNPFHRGAVVRRSLLCDNLPQPDPNTLPPGSLEPPPIQEATSTRERFAAKVDGNPLCEGCHLSFSPLGYVMEAYDSLGRYRETERVFDEETGELLGEVPVDATGKVAVASNSEPAVSGPAELNQLIVNSGKVEACMAESYFKYVARRATEAQSIDQCVVEDLSEVLASKEGGLAEAFQRIARMPTFFARKVGEP